MSSRLRNLFLCLLIFSAPEAKPQAPPASPLFEDVAAQSGLTVSHISSSDKHYIIESMSGGVGLFDCDNDGKLDIAIVNGSTVEHFRENGGDPMVTVYRQGLGMKFTDVTAAAGLKRRGWGMGVTAVDYDNDGLVDLFVTGYGGNVLYHNLGNCKFEDGTEKAGVRGGGFSTGAAWADYDRDGNADLFVSRYVHVDINDLPGFGSKPFCRYKGLLVQCGPAGLPGESDLLFRNRGDGTFEEVSHKAGVDDPKKYYGLGVIWADYDNDGWPDLFVANDSTPNYLYHNNHDGTFTEVGGEKGVAYTGEGHEQGWMGVDFGDDDHHGMLDLLVTNFAQQAKGIFHNLGAKGFEDVSYRSRIALPGFPYVGWGTGFIDFANDGWPGIFMVNGHVYPQVDVLTEGARYREPVLLFANQRDGTFKDITQASGLGDLPPASRRGAAFGDINNSGNIGMVLLNVGQPPTLLMNRTKNGNHRVMFKAVGVTSNREAIGTRITVHSGKLTQFAEVRAGGSYLSQNDTRLHFGIGAATKLEAVEVRWPNGKVENLGELAADKIYKVVEGKGVVETTNLPPP